MRKTWYSLKKFSVTTGSTTTLVLATRCMGTTKGNKHTRKLGLAYNFRLELTHGQPRLHRHTGTGMGPGAVLTIANPNGGGTMDVTVPPNAPPGTVIHVPVAPQQPVAVVPATVITVDKA